MGGQIQSDRAQVESAAYDVYDAAGEFEEGTAAKAGSSTGAGYNRLIELAGRIHPLMARVSSSLRAEADAVSDIATTLDQTDQNAASQIDGGR